MTGQVDWNKTICIDPGHGFGDIGAGSEYIGDLSEKDINLKFAKFLSDELASRGYDVFMTHDGETFPKTEIDNGNNNYDYKEPYRVRKFRWDGLFYLNPLQYI